MFIDVIKGGKRHHFLISCVFTLPSSGTAPVWIEGNEKLDKHGITWIRLYSSVG